MTVQRFVRRQKLSKKQREEKKKGERKDTIAKSAQKYQQLKRIRALSQSTFTDQQGQNFRDELELQKGLLLKEEKTLSKELSTELCSELEPCRSGNHQADVNTEGSIITQTLMSNRQKRLKKIEEALKRLDEGIYGICLECFQTIDLKRISSTPIADLCQQCKEEKEQKENARRPNGANHRHQRADQLYYASA